jgi:hypothetical protein
MDVLHNLPQLVTAVGGLGTAAFGLVDATKVFWGGVNHIGFSKIAKRVSSLVATGEQVTNALPPKEVLNTLKGNWFNGTDIGSQKSIAKSLIKLHMNPDNSVAIAKATNIDPEVLTTVAKKQSSGEALTPGEGDVYARFDLILTAMLDETYQIADDDYRNATRAIAALFGIGLSVLGWLILHHDNPQTQVSFWDAAITGVLATPLAPIAKDLSTALATAVNTLQLVKK